MQKLKKPVSILLSVLMVLSVFAAVPMTAGAATVSYVKVTTAPDDWSGDYLIVFEDEEGNKAFNGSADELNSSGNYIDVTISGGEIESNAATDAAKVTIAQIDGGYSIATATGAYIGGVSGQNKLDFRDEAILNTISLDNDGNAEIVSNNTYLRFNTSWSGFRYYKTVSQRPVQLYKLTGGSAPAPTYDYTTDGNDGYYFNDPLNVGVGDTLATLNGYSSLFNFKILGVQKKSDVDVLSSDSKKDVRFVSVINTEILKDADEYGYVFAKFDSKEDARAHADEIQAYGDNVLTKECTTTSNTISGNYGLYNEDTNYKYVTATVNGIGDDTVAARFYIKKGSTYYYADYTNDQNQTYGVCAAAYSDLT